MLTVRGLATLDFLLEESAGSGAGAAAAGHTGSAAGQRVIVESSHETPG